MGRANLTGKDPHAGKTDAEAKTQVFWPSNVKRLTGEDPDAGKD